ncbi:CocE/NonD family hydrolase [Gracilimonas mengyeensis]|uniref:Xaa-Pro dipeptidyl-peptidase C-terminal domain-containing protein n=1 Tax=Gracilimonas mengyeensis TaxID=1302730 RepID=A0A521F536_9BACT|nr:CocE/NonD family hydrolase [Gracilimonas mengyeensis]SMO91264.1 hypothetical protein SAMN06265219_11555 [Gracilimonas mengyeensis]
MLYAKSLLLSFLLALTFYSSPSFAQNPSNEDYTKQELQIEMRDGIKLHTTIYAPKDTSKSYPILIKRTPYSCRPYGEDAFPYAIHSNPYLVESGYIFVCQDVRGRWMSEGSYSTMTPNIPGPEGPDESSDTYDTIEWLLANIPNHIGKVGQYGISYPGYYTTAVLPNAHPALVASSPQAPIADFFFDDFHHQGAYLMGYWFATNVFGYQHEGPTDTSWYSLPEVPGMDFYQFALDSLTPLSKSLKYYGEDNFFWQEIINHPNYDDFWQSRNILPHLRDIDHAVLVVGGWFDAEDLYGPLHTYQTIEKENPEAANSIVMGPWSHGDWARSSEHQLVGDIYFGDDLSDFFKKEMEYPFFEAHLKGEGDANIPEAYMFDTGRKEWRKFDQWPPKKSSAKTWFIHGDGSLNESKPSGNDDAFSEYVSDLSKPVPHIETPELRFTPRPYMTSDQRFAARRPDVLTFETEVLKDDLTLAGDILANLYVSTTGTASDWIVKLVDVYPQGVKEPEEMPEGVELDNYHQMVRSEVIRGRFRNSYEEPEPFVPGEITYVDLPLQDVLHTFKKGHKIQVQIQSTWFPLIDLNPQKYVPNIFEASEADFINATQRVYHEKDHPSSIEVKVLEQ